MVLGNVSLLMFEIVQQVTKEKIAIFTLVLVLIEMIQMFVLDVVIVAHWILVFVMILSVDPIVKIILVMER